MKVSVVGSTKPGYVIPHNEALNFSGLAAGICYMPGSFSDLWEEDPEKTKKRVLGNLGSGHHSVFGHVYYNLVIEECPKIIAMILNNEKVYTTSEKSARYTKMKSSGREKELYDKWLEIFKKVISDKYPKLGEKAVEKLAQENARYLISVFTPATTMEYTVSLQQLNYILGFTEEFIGAHHDPFGKKISVALQDLVEAIPDMAKVEGLRDFKGRKFSLFATRERREEFGENYSVNYRGTLAQLAQAQRHRTLYYEMRLDEHPEFYTPPIIEDTGYETEWQLDIYSLKDNFPQGMIVNINERGTIENFALKCGERLCGSAQLEIAQRTYGTLSRYVSEISNQEDPIDENMIDAMKDIEVSYTRCRFLKGYKCVKPCAFPGIELLFRKI